MDESESDESSELYEELDYSFEHCYICKEYSDDKVFVMPGTCKTRGIVIKDEYLDNEIVVFKEGEIGPVEEGVQIVYYNDIVELTSEEYYENFGQTEFLNKYCLQKSTVKNKLNWYKTEYINGGQYINFSISVKKYSIFNILKNSQKD